MLLTNTEPVYPAVLAQSLERRLGEVWTMVRIDMLIEADGRIEQDSESNSKQTNVGSYIFNCGIC
jgi:hypothetical protein